MKGKVLHQPRTFDLPGAIYADVKAGRITWKYDYVCGTASEVGNAEEQIENISGIQAALDDIQNILGKSPTQIILDDPFLQKEKECVMSNKESIAPLCKFGPGGDYVREYTPKSGSAPKVRAWISRMITKLRHL